MCNNLVIVSQILIGKARISIQFYLNSNHRPFLLSRTVRVGDPMPWGGWVRRIQNLFVETHSVSQKSQNYAPTNKTQWIICLFPMGKPKKDKYNYLLTRHRTLPFHIWGNVLRSYKRNIDMKAENMSPLKLLEYLSVSVIPGCMCSVEGEMLRSLAPIWCPGWMTTRVIEFFQHYFHPRST